MTPRLQRIFAAGSGTLPTDCVVDIGALTRWMYESAPREVQDTWAAIVQAIGSSRRKYIWIAALPGDVTRAFGQLELNKAVQFLQSRGIGSIIHSSESVTSLLISTTLSTATNMAVITADISTYPEQRLVLEHRLATLLDVATGAVHTDVTAYKAGDREAMLTALIAAIIRPDPKTGKPPGGNAAPKYEYQLELALLGIEDESLPRIPVYVLNPYRKNRERVQERAREVINANVDNVARAAVGRALPRSSPIVMATTTPPVVILATENANNGGYSMGKAGAIALVGAAKFKAEDVFSSPRLLRDISAASPKTWIAPRALDLLDYMVEQGIPLPEKVIDPAHCAFALGPDDIDRAIAACPSARALTNDEARWLWDVKRKTNAPSSLESLANVLPDIVNELRQQAQMRGMDALIDDDIAPTLPVLAAMERRGAWVALDRIDRAWSRLQIEMTRLERLFGPSLGSIDPYEAPPEQLLRTIQKHGQVYVPSEYTIRNNDAKNDLLRLAHHYRPAQDLLKARTISEIQDWLARATKSGGRLRGRHFPEATGRWGMNAWHLQGMPKHSPWAKILRGLLEGPPGKVLLAADYSSFELRLVAGLSRDPRFLTAAQQEDAIGFLASMYFAQPLSPDERARMKSYLHPINYGISAEGFAKVQTSVPVARALDHYEQLRTDFKQLFAWRTQVTASLAGGAPVRTRGGWQRDPTLAKRGKQALQNAAVSTVVQGLAADILRWVLRRLNQVLPPTAELVFQNHDEVYVAADKEEVPQVSALMKTVLEQDILTSNLVPANIRLVAKIRTGRSWGDLL